MYEIERRDLSYSGNERTAESATADYTNTTSRASKRLLLADRHTTIGVLFSAILLALFASTLALTLLVEVAL